MQKLVYLYHIYGIIVKNENKGYKNKPDVHLDGLEKMIKIVDIVRIQR